MTTPHVTIGATSRLALEAWAETEGVSLHLQWFLYVLGFHTKLQWGFVGTAMDSLGRCEPTLRRWKRRGMAEHGMEALAAAWVLRPPDSFKYRRPTTHPPTKDFGEKGAPRGLYLFLLFQCQDPLASDLESQVALRVWLLVKALTFASRGNVADEYLREACTRLRIAAYERDRDWANVFAALSGFTDSREQFEARLGSPSLDDYVDRPARDAGLPDKHLVLIAVLRALAGGGESPDDVDALDASTIPAPLRSLNLPDTGIGDGFAPDDGDRGAQLLQQFPGPTTKDGEDSSQGILVISQDPDASPPEQEESVRTVQLLLNADARFLVWDWNRPSPVERVALNELILRTLAESSEPETVRLIAALAALALATGRSLPEVMRVPLINDLNSRRGLWRLDIRRGVLLQTAPRREGHWRPTSGTQLPIRAALDELIWTLPDALVSVLRAAHASVPSATTVANLWGELQRGSGLTTFNRWVQSNASTARLSYGCLAQDLGVRVFLSSGDPVLARLMGARSLRGLPAATAYTSYTEAKVSEHQQLGYPANDGRNAAGGLMDLEDDEILRSGFRRVRARLLEAIATGDFVGWHNLLARYWDARLRAATGARPIGLLWRWASDIDWTRNFSYVDDKGSSQERAGRLVPIPRALLEQFRRSFLQRHLPLLWALVGEQLVPQDGAPDLLFLLERDGSKLYRRPIVHADRASLGIENPLPTNLLRHRLRTYLHRASADLEVVDSIFGHHDGATLTHGAYAMRVWLDDALALEPHLADALDALEISSPPEWATAGEWPTLYPNADRLIARLRANENADVELRKKSIGRWRAEALELIKMFLEERLGKSFHPVIGAHSLLDQLAKLDEAQLDQLCQRLCRTTKGLPAVGGIERVDVLNRLAACSSRYKRKPLKLGRRYLLDAQEASPFSRLAPSAGTMVASMASALDQTYSENAHRSKVSAKDAALFILMDVMVHSGATNPKLLQALLERQEELRLVTLEELNYLEWSPGTSLEEHPEAAVQRFQITRRAALLLVDHLASNRVLQYAASDLTLRQRIADALGLLPGTSFASWLSSACDVIRQENALTLPGSVAAFLDGRIMTASLDQSDWVHLRTGTRRAAAWQKINRIPHSPSLYGGMLLFPTVIDLGSTQGSPQYIQSRRDSADAFLLMVKERLKEMIAAGTKNRRDLQVDALESAIGDYGVASNDGPSNAIRMLGFWSVHLLRLKRANGYAQLIVETVQRYLVALSGQFLALAYDADLEELKSDEIGALYRTMLQTSTVKKTRFQFERLREFHFFAQGAFGVESCAWSEVAPGEASSLGAPGLIDEATYLHALLLSESWTPPLGIAVWQCTATLILAYRFGLRRSECVSMSMRDLMGWPTQPVVAVRRRFGGRIKTPAAKRLVPLLFGLEPVEQRAFQRLLDHHIAGSMGIEHPPLLGDLGDPKKQLDIAVLSAYLNRLLRAASGRRGLTLHDLRHSFANKLWCAIEAFRYRLPASAAGRSEDFSSIRSRVLGLETNTPSRRGMWAIARLLGHTHGSMALRSYIHLVPEIAIALRFGNPQIEPDWPKPAAFEGLALELLEEAHPTSLQSSETYEALTPRLAIEAMKLIPLRGQRAVEATIGLRDGSLKRLAALITGLEQRLTKFRRPLSVALVAGEEASAAIKGSNESDSHARAASTGILHAIRQSAYARLRVGLSLFQSDRLKYTPELAGQSAEYWSVMCGPDGELSVWSQVQLEFVLDFLKECGVKLERITARAPAKHVPWAQSLLTSSGYPLTVAPARQLPAVKFESSGTAQQRRLALLIDDSAAGFLFNRAETIVALACVVSCLACAADGSTTATTASP